MKKRVFVNDGLASIIVPFVGKMESRIATLLMRDVLRSGEEGSDERMFELPEELLDGICADIVEEIYRTRDSAIVSRLGLSSETISEFIYLLAALVDEMLISMLKAQLPRRFNGMVEYAVFGTRDAGEQVFMRIDRLLSRRSQLDFSLAGAYVLMLSLGFRGQYFQQGKSEVIARYHRDLSALALRIETDSIVSRLPGDVNAGARPELATYRTLLFLWCAVGLTWLVAVLYMEILWSSETEALRRTADKLLEAALPTLLQGHDK